MRITFCKFLTFKNPTFVECKIILALVFLCAPFFTLIAQAENLDSLKQKLKKNPQLIKVREELAQKYLDDKKFKEVIQILAPYSNEISNEGLINLGQAYNQTEDHLNEIRTFSELVEKDPVHFRPRFYLGMAFKSAKRLDDATENFRASIERAPKHLPSYNELLNIFLEKKQYYEGRLILNDLIRVFGEKSEYLNLLCKLFADDGYNSEALNACKKAININPKHPDNHIYLAQTYYNQNNKVAADRIFLTAGRQFTTSEFAQYAAGAYYLQEKNYATSVRYLKNATQLNPSSFRAQITLARALFETKDYQTSLTHFVKSCGLDKSKETYTEMRTSAAKLRQSNENKIAEDFDRKASVCQK